MLHENDMANGGCEFLRFFQTTPQDLISGGLYTALAVAFYPGPFRPVSIALARNVLANTGSTTLLTIMKRMSQIITKKMSRSKKGLAVTSVAANIRLRV